MGTDFKCGCRFSQGHWSLCQKHKDIIIVDDCIKTIKKRAFYKKLREKFGGEK